LYVLLQLHGLSHRLLRYSGDAVKTRSHLVLLMSLLRYCSHDVYCTPAVPAGTQLQWPRGGPQAIADALVRGLRSHGGKLLLGQRVSSVLQGPGGRAAGVVVAGGGQVGARTAVVSNASLWDTQRLLPDGAQLQEFEQQVRGTVL
jgi:hypothetical protein